MALVASLPDTPLCFEARPELVVNLAADARSETTFVAPQEPLDGTRLALCQFTERPRHGFYDHLIAIIEKELADGERSFRLRVLGATRTTVEGHGRHQGCAAPPSIARACPPRHDRVRDDAEAPGDATREARKAVDVRPSLHALAKRLDVGAPGRGDRSRRGAQDLEAEPLFGSEGGAKHRGVGSAAQAFDDRSRASSPHRIGRITIPKPSNEGAPPACQTAQGAAKAWGFGAG